MPSQRLLLYIMIAVSSSFLILLLIITVRIVRGLHSLKACNGDRQIIEIDQQTELQEGEFEFLQKRTELNSALGLNPLFGLLMDFGTLRKISTTWVVPGTGLMVSGTRYISLVGSQSHVSEDTCVYSEGDSHGHFIVTNNQSGLIVSSRELRENGAHIAPPNYETHQLVALAWAVAVQQGRTINRSTSAEDHLKYLRREFKKHIDHETDRGHYRHTADGELRVPWLVILKSLFLVPGLLAWGEVRKRLHRRMFAQHRKQLQNLLGENVPPTSIIPAVQHRVRTGSTAPLTQP